MKETKRGLEQLRKLIHFASQTLEEPNEYAERYVAFIDVIGFKVLVESNESGWIKTNIYDEIRKVEMLLHTGEYKVVLPEESCKSLEFILISDSIVISIDEKAEDALDVLFSACLILQQMFLNKSNPILLRGAICKGGIFHFEQITFGPALTQAYLLENEVAIYPRILIDKSISVHEICKRKDSLTKAFCIIDSDGQQFVDYIKFLLVFAHDLAIKCKTLYDYIQQNREKYFSNERIYVKYNWIAKRFNSALEFCCKDSQPSYIEKYSIRFP